MSSIQKLAAFLNFLLSFLPDNLELSNGPYMFNVYGEVVFRDVTRQHHDNRKDM